MRDREERRAEEERTRVLQMQLFNETQRRNRGFGGLRSLLGPLGSGGGGPRSLLGSG
jgi:hypothetical protein